MEFVFVVTHKKRRKINTKFVEKKKRICRREDAKFDGIRVCCHTQENKEKKKEERMLHLIEFVFVVTHSKNKSTREW